MSSILKSLSRSMVSRSAAFNALSYGMVFLTIYLVRYTVEAEVTWEQSLLAITTAIGLGASVGILAGSAAFLMLQRHRHSLTRARQVQTLIAGAGMVVFEVFRVGPFSWLAAAAVIVIAGVVSALSWMLSRWGLGDADPPQTQLVSDRRRTDPMRP